MVKNIKIPLNKRIEIFQAWLYAVNWTLGDNKLSDSELEILSYFLYYNDKYKTIIEDDIRGELIFSTGIKKKIKAEFEIDSQKLETYLNKLRKKGIINNNVINPSLMVYPGKDLKVVYDFSIVEQYNNFVPEPEVEEEEDIEEDELIDEELFEVDYNPYDYDYDSDNVEEELEDE